MMLNNPLRFDTIAGFLQAVLDAVVQITFPIIVLFLVYVGFLFVFHGNNPDKLKKDREYLLWAILGALIVLGAKALSIAIEATVAGLSS